MPSTLEDSLFSAIGDPGRYQVYLAIVLAGTYLFISCNYFNMSFYGWIPPYHCKTEEEMILHNITDNVVIIPANFNSTHPITQCEINVQYNSGNKSIKCREFHGWIYETEFDDHTIVTEWDLICEKQILINICTSVYFVGVLLGGVIFGSIADKYGRKPVILGTLIGCLPLGIALGFSKALWQFIVLRFAIGVLVQGLQLSGVALLYESISHEWKYVLGPILYIGWGCGIFGVAVTGYLIHYWRYMQFVFCVVNAISIISVIGIMESPRWLITQGKLKQGIAVLQGIVTINSIRNGVSAIVITPVKEENRSYNITSVFRTPKIRKYMIVHLFLWMLIALIYYGLCLGITNQPGSKNVNALIGGTLQVVHFSSLCFIMKRVRRRVLIPVHCSITCVCCLINAALPKYTANGFDTKWISCSFYYIAMVIPTGTYAVLVYYVSETFPTVLRGIAIGLTFAISRLGMTITSLIMFLQYVLHEKAPIYIFAALSLICILLSLLLPETLGKPLPNTIEDVEEDNSTDFIIKQEAAKENDLKNCEERSQTNNNDSTSL